MTAFDHFEKPADGPAPTGRYLENELWDKVAAGRQRGELLCLGQRGLTEILDSGELSELPGGTLVYRVGGCGARTAAWHEGSWVAIACANQA